MNASTQVEAKPRWRQARGIVRRVVATGRLVLQTPAHFGEGEADDLTDMPLARDPKDGLPLLTGASIAGAARNYLREWEHGYGVGYEVEHEDSLTRRLFGDVIEKESIESRLIVDDAYGSHSATELRDGVAINPETRTAEKGKLFDTELLEAGTAFDLRFELALPEGEDGLLAGFAVALTGFKNGEIGLGTRKRRGLGQCKVEKWDVQSFDLRDGKALVQWIKGDPGARGKGTNIAEQLRLKGPLEERVPDRRHRFTLDAAFELESTLLIRSGIGDGNSPDMVHLKSRRGGRLKPILSGTSLAGAMRARGLKIAKTLDPAGGGARVNRLFGPRLKPGDKNPCASRAAVRESELTGTRELVQSRVRIDRFTGGTYPGALFTQQPAIGGMGSRVNLWVEVRCPAGEPMEPEIGLLLQVLKDLWTGDLPLGGEASVGRGRLGGINASLTEQKDGSRHTWTIEKTDDKLRVTDSKGEDAREALEQRFGKTLEGGQAS